MGDYSKALAHYEKNLEITQKVLSPNHPNLATSWNNIDSVYTNMGKYSEALSSFERSLEIYKAALPPNRPRLATSHDNICNVYHSMSEYSKAHIILVQVLPPTHPYVEIVKSSIERVKKRLSQ